MEPLAPEPPSLSELRSLWVQRPPELSTVRRLIREVQHLRLRLVQIAALMDEHDRKLRSLGLDNLRDRYSPFRKAEALVLAEIRRVGTIEDAPRQPSPGAHAKIDQNLHPAAERKSQ